ncbi:MAG: hypothetical protein KGH59_01545 [Candidatus Micrarchaeota archaeon]|nr:hypothetical protein [Candidatus Micrarchaeota archaeon]MDE1804448.1 hypothetical protein [Candidatus Micrarchaeota archaeon]MDE1847076.1 hypothetical protein [Candidatus Micrarchaeota archaeon]
MIPEIKKITKSLSKLQQRQDKVMQLSREVVRLSGESISNMHAKRHREVGRQLARLKRMIAQLRRMEVGFEYYSMQAHQEYVEAYVLYNIISKGRLPSMRELGEGEVSYMLGIMDSVGELKRESFEELRSGNLDAARGYYEAMQGIYDSALHMRFANSVLPNFRKKQDVARIQLESTGSELLRLGGMKKQGRNKL